MAISKVILDDTTLMDVTDKTVDTSNMLYGATALKNDGTSVTGSIVSKTSSDVSISGNTVTVPSGYFPQSVQVNAGVDLSEDTVTVGSLLEGITAHDASGSAITGTIPTKTGSNLSVSGDTVTVPAGYYASQATASVNSGTITNNTSGGTSSGTINRGSQIKIGAGYYDSDTYYTAQSNSGTYTVSSSGTKTVNGYYYASVASCTVTNNTTLPSGSTSSGTINSGSYIKIGTGYNDSIKYYKAENSSVTLTSVTITPSEEETETIAGPGYAYNNVTVEAIPSTYVGSGVTKKSATTYAVSSTGHTISSGTYLTGTQTISGVTTENITAGNIKSGVTIKVGDAGNAGRIKNVNGTFTSSSTVSSGQTAATAANIHSGYSAWVNGSEVKGTAQTYAQGQNSVNVTAGTWTTKSVGESGRAYCTFSPSAGTGNSYTLYIGSGTQNGTSTGYFEVYVLESASASGTYSKIKAVGFQMSAEGWNGSTNKILLKSANNNEICSLTITAP